MLARRRPGIAGGCIIACAVFLLFGLLKVASGAEPKFTSIEELRSLGPDELVGRHQVRVEGVVVGVSQNSRRVLIQDGGFGLGITPPRGSEKPLIGSRIRVDGATINAVAARVATERWEVLDPDVGVPEPQVLSVQEAVDLPQSSGQLVRVSGFVQAVRRPKRGTGTLFYSRVRAELRENHRVLTVLATEGDRVLGVDSQLGEITATGVLRDVPSTNGVVRRCVWVFDLAHMSVDRKGPADPFERSFATPPFVEPGKSYTNREPLRIRGRVVETFDNGGFSLDLAGAAESVLLCENAPLELTPDMVVELLGYPLVSNSVVRLDVIDVREMTLPAAKLTGGSQTVLADYESIMTEIPEVHGLTGAEIGRGVPVRLLGRVSYWNELENIFYLQHYKGNGVRVIWQGTNALPVYNDTVVVSGYVTNGIRYPRVVGQSLEKIANRKEPLPTARLLGGGFRSGRHDGRRVQMDGVVRSVLPGAGEDVAVVRIVLEGVSVPARVQLSGEAMPTDWVDAVVTMRGVCAARRELPGAKSQQVFLVQRPTDVEVKQAGVPDPFANQKMGIKDVLDRSWDDRFVHRVRVEGAVTYASAKRIFVDDGSVGIEVQARGDLSILPGDRVIAVGFPTPGKVAPVLEEAIVRRISGGELPAAESVAAADVLGRDLNGRYIRTHGEVIGHPGIEGNGLELRAGGVTFSVVVPSRLIGSVASLWPVGAQIEVGGICRVEWSDESGEPERFRVMLNDEDAVVVLAPPSWWTPERVGLSVGALLLLAVGAMGWAAYFRNRAGQNRRQFLTTFHANPMPAWIVRRGDLVCVELNGEFEGMFAVTREDVVGRSLVEMGLWRNESDGQDFVRLLNGQPSLRAEEAQLCGRDGKDHRMLLSTEPIEEDGVDCVLLIAYDVTERLKLLEQLRQSQKMEAIGQLAAGVAHDFNNLMTVVRGNAGLLLLGEDLGPDSRTLTGEIEEAAGRAAELTSQMLAFSRKSTLHRKVIDLRDVIRTSAGMLNRMIGETIEVSYECPSDPVVVKADAGMLDQVLLNLGVNARDAMPDGGSLSMRVREIEYRPDDVPRHADARAGRFAMVEVSDTGTGMTDDVRRHAFEPFFTTKDVGRGTGLGLSTVYGILRQHGGWIDLETEPGEGCVFRLQLPLCEKSVEEESENCELPSDVIGRGDETILVVEDQETVRRTIERTLRHHGYTVLVTEDGAAAESLWNEKRDEVDLVLTDLVMPNGLSGFELARRLRGRQPDLKIIYMTGHSQELIDHAGELQPGIDFLPKPFENRELVRIIRERLDGAVDPAHESDVAAL